MSAETRLAETLGRLGVEMPAAPEPKGVYRPVVVVGTLAQTAGHLPMKPGGELLRGRLGEDLDLEAGQEAARWATLGILATLRRQCGSLDRVRRVVKVLGMVNSTADFTQHPAVLNGCSELLAEVFGPERGAGARSAVGVAALPLGAAVEIEALFELETA